MNNKYYITTAIDYIDGKPHIGHSYEKVAADVLARFHRAQGIDARFLT
ncbi:MAG TPA: class I tRNA ligase family protein, partial [Candidatus Doudnabacteria bacterium]|nr:class I tRNA ligase family protein [Candidatus Doudnabacteria bacterium]